MKPLTRHTVKTLLLLTLVPLLLFRSRPSLAAGLPGDLNGSGDTTAADAAVLLRAAERVSALPAAMEPQADVTANGTVDGTDAKAALWLATGQIQDYDAFCETIRHGLVGEEAFDRFRYTGVTDPGDGNYRSQNVSVTLVRGAAYESVYFLADVYLRDLASLRTRFGGNAYLGGSEYVAAMSETCGAIVAVNGDYYSFRSCGPLVRNGETFRDFFSFSGDIAFLLKDGTFRTMTPGAARVSTLAALDPWQTWLFGPALLNENGKAKTTFVSELTKANPRTVVGYYAPGHYALLVVDGRMQGYSAGTTLSELAALCETLGMKQAYNLDGGQSSVITGKNGILNAPPSIDGRPVSDMIYIAEPDAAYR